MFLDKYLIIQHVPSHLSPHFAYEEVCLMVVQFHFSVVMIISYTDCLISETLTLLFRFNAVQSIFEYSDLLRSFNLKGV